MSQVWATFETASASAAAFVHDDTPIAWGDIRASVGVTARKIGDSEGPVYLHTRSAAAFLTGMLACLQLRRPLVCPAHGGRIYLEEIASAAGGVLVGDTEDPRSLSLTVAELRGTGAPSPGTGPAPPTAEGSVRITMMTSGTTAAPKAVHKTLGDLEREAAALESLWGGAAGTVYGTVSHQHIYGLLFRVVWPVLAGRPSTALPADYWEQLQGCLGKESVLVSSPAHLSRLPPLASGDLGRPRTVFSSGGPLAFADVEACRERLGQAPVEVLGSTETGGIAWRRQERGDEAWTPLPGVRVDADADGCLSVRSPFFGRDEAMNTGDRVEIVRDGGFRLLGRSDRVVKLEGKRVSLTRIEQALRELAGVEDAGAVVVDRPRPTLAAVVVLDPAARNDLLRLGSFAVARRMRRRLASKLEAMERPKLWRFVDRIPVDTQGKRALAGLRALFDPADHPGLEPAEQAGAPPAEKAGAPAEAVRRADPGAAVIDLVLDPAWIWFDGHFPGRPIFPGIAEVHLAVSWAQRLWRWQPATSHMRRLKFMRTLHPEDRLRLVLERSVEADTLSFRYYRAGAIVGEGVIGGVL